MKWLHFIFSHSIFISLCAAALSLQTLQLLGLPVDWILLLFIFFATICSYNAYWMLSKFSFNSKTPVLIFLQKQRGHWLMILLSVAGMIACFLQLNLVLYNIIIGFFLMSLYAAPLLPFAPFSKARKLGFLKTLLLALTWAHVTTLIPLQKPITAMQLPEWLVLGNRFLFMLLLCIIFDKRDAAVDKIRGLHSLATDISTRTLDVIVAAVFIMYTVLLFFSLQYFIDWKQFAALELAGITALAVYHLSKKNRGYAFYYFGVDGLMLFSALATYVAGIS